MSLEKNETLKLPPSKYRYIHLAGLLNPEEGIQHVAEYSGSNSVVVGSSISRDSRDVLFLPDIETRARKLRQRLSEICDQGENNVIIAHSLGAKELIMALLEETESSDLNNINAIVLLHPQGVISNKSKTELMKSSPKIVENVAETKWLFPSEEDIFKVQEQIDQAKLSDSALVLRLKGLKQVVTENRQKYLDEIETQADSDLFDSETKAKLKNLEAKLSSIKVRRDKKLKAKVNKQRDKILRKRTTELTFGYNQEKPGFKEFLKLFYSGLIRKEIYSQLTDEQIKDLGKLKIPIVFVWGSDDHYFPAAEGLGESRLIDLEFDKQREVPIYNVEILGYGHGSYLANPEHFSWTIERIVDRMTADANSDQKNLAKKVYLSGPVKRSSI